MTEPRHRKVRRKKGVTLRGSGGRRRASGILDEAPPSREELSVAARKRAAVRARLRIAREKLGLHTTKEGADHLGIAPSTLGAYEREENSPSADML